MTFCSFKIMPSFIPIHPKFMRGEESVPINMHIVELFMLKS